MKPWLLIYLPEAMMGPAGTGEALRNKQHHASLGGKTILADWLGKELFCCTRVCL